jgi:hypothetical protein
MARFVRLYNSPDTERVGTVIGFSAGITKGARDPFLHKWLHNRGYSVTPESPEQLARQLALGSFIMITPEYAEVSGVPIPDETVSAGHLLVEPSLKDEDLEPLGFCLSSLESLYDRGLRRHVLVDNRVETPTPYEAAPINIIYAWG